MQPSDALLTLAHVFACVLQVGLSLRRLLMQEGTLGCGVPEFKLGTPVSDFLSIRMPYVAWSWAELDRVDSKVALITSKVNPL